MALTSLNVPPHLQNETFFEIKSFSTKPIQEELLPYHNGPFLFFLTLHFISLSNKIVRVPDILAPAFLMALDLRVGACNPLVVTTSGLLRGEGDYCARSLRGTRPSQIPPFAYQVRKLRNRSVTRVLGCQPCYVSATKNFFISPPSETPDFFITLFLSFLFTTSYLL